MKTLTIMVAMFAAGAVTAGCSKKADDAKPSAAETSAKPAEQPAKPIEGSAAAPAAGSAGADPWAANAAKADPGAAKPDPGAAKAEPPAAKHKTPENLAACKKVMAATRACQKDKKFLAAIKKGFGWTGGWKHAFDTSDEACDAFLDPESYLDADENPRVSGADLTDKKVLDGLVAVAAKGDCAALAKEFNSGDPNTGRVGYPYVGPEAL